MELLKLCFNKHCSLLEFFEAVACISITLVSSGFYLHCVEKMQVQVEKSGKIGFFCGTDIFAGTCLGDLAKGL